MRCPFCSYHDTQVKDSRPAEDNLAIRRRRFCPKCQARFSTFERVQFREILVTKKNGQHRPFDRDKLIRSINIAIRKRDISPAQVEKLVSTIVGRIETSGNTEVSSQKIGEMVMEELALLDQVAYVRFASVYRDFREAKDFSEFIEKNQKPKIRKK